MAQQYTPTLDVLKSFLQKARRRLSDESPDYADQDEAGDLPLEDDVHEQGDGEGGEDDADKYLREHDPDSQTPAEESPATEESEGSAAAAEDVPEALPAKPTRRKVISPTATPTAAQPATTDADEFQPSREELAEMREYTRPWEQRARDHSRLEARPEVNPVKHLQGRIVEARNLSAADRQKAYDEFTKSPEYQNADPISQIEMDGKFHADWHTQHPDHFKNALHTHAEAHKKGREARGIFERAKDEKVQHIAGGGVQPEAYTLEEGMQHAGGSRDEDEAPSGITQDQGAKFASGNQEFVQNYMKDYGKRTKKYGAAADLDSFDNGTRADIDTVLGENMAVKDPARKAKMDAFFARYHPLIGKAARRTLSKLGLSDQGNRGQIDYGLLHEAGMHALFQAVNDYDHDHPSQAKFTTHLNHKMHGLMQTALRTQQAEVPESMRAGAKKFDQQKRTANAAPVKITDKTGNTRIVNADGTPYQPEAPKPPTAATPTPPPAATPPPAPKPVTPPMVRRRASHEIATAHPPEVQERLKRISAARGTVPKPSAPEGSGGEE